MNLSQRALLLNWCTAKTGRRQRGNDDSTASAMDRSRGASVEDVGQEESKRGLYRKIARPLRRVSENKSTRIESDPLQEPEGEEMSAPGPAWSAEEEELLRSLAAAGESAAAISTLLKRTPHAVRKRAHVLNITLARSLPGPKTKWK